MNLGNSTECKCYFSNFSAIIISRKEVIDLDQIKIGRFITDIRKEHKLTQKQLAEKLNISDKTISKWETGKGLPEVSLMMPLCEILGINVNELLSGERLSDETYREKAEENVMNLVREKEESKKKIIVSVIVAILGVSVLLVCVLLTAYIEQMSFLIKALLVSFGVIVFIVGLGIAIFLDRDAGTFECKKCGTCFTPGLKEYIMGPHTITKRYLKCPHCGESSYCKHKLTR